MKINQLKSGVILSYLTQAVYILSGLLYTPIMLRLLGQSEYGLYQLVCSIVSYLGILSFGFNSSYMRYYCQTKAKSDSSALARLNGMFMTIFIIISLISAVCGTVMLLRIDIIFADGLTFAQLSKARLLMGFSVFNMSISFINSVFTSYLSANEEFFFQRIIEFLRTLFSPFLTLPLLLLGFDSVAIVCISTVLTMFSLTANCIYCFKKLHIKFTFGKFNFKLLKEMWIFTFFIFINMIIDQINWNVDKFLLGRMLGTTAVGIYSVAGQLNTMYINFSTSVSGVFIPRINTIVAENQSNNVLTNLFTRVGRIQLIILALVMSGFTVFGNEFINLWAGNEYSSAYRIGLYLMLPATVPMLQTLGIEIQRAKNMHQARSVVYLFTAIANILISIPYIKLYGAEGAAMGTAFSMLIGNGLFMNIYYHKRIGLNMLYFWKEILKFIPALSVPVLFGTVLNLFFPAADFFMLIIEISAYTAVYCISMWFIGMNVYEKELLLGKLKSIKNKR